MPTGSAVSEGNEITHTKMNLKLESVADADVTAGAAIAWTKLAALTDAHILVGDGSNDAVDVAVSGDITMANDGTVAIAAGVIVTADVKSDAAIAWSKMAALTDTHILVGNVSNVAVDVAVSGDISMGNDGAVAIAAGVIVNADVAAGAVIAWTKMEALADTHILVGDGSNDAVDVAMSGDATLANTGALTIAANAVTVAKVEDALFADTLGAFLVSFETDEAPCVIKLYVNHKVTVNKVRSIVVKALAATDDGTITLASAGGAMADGVITVAASSAINDEDTASPSTNNVIAADSYIQLTVDKTTKGGKALVTIELTRTA